MCGSVTEISEAEAIGKSYVSRILRLALLAPDIVDAILAGETDQALMLERLERPLATSWGRAAHSHSRALDVVSHLAERLRSTYSFSVS